MKLKEEVFSMFKYLRFDNEGEYKPNEFVDFC